MPTKNATYHLMLAPFLYHYQVSLPYYTAMTFCPVACYHINHSLVRGCYGALDSLSWSYHLFGGRSLFCTVLYRGTALLADMDMGDWSKCH